MAKILRLKDRIKLTIGEVTFKIAPLSYLQKQKLAGCTKMQDGKEIYDLARAQAMYIKFALKDIEGVEDYSGNKYELSFEGDELTDECVSEIFHLEEREKLNIAAWQLIQGVQDLKDPVTGEALEGVDLEVESGK